MEIETVEAGEKVVVVRYRGVLYRRYPAAKRLSDRVYFRASGAGRKAGRRYLHRDIWADNNGSVPDGHEVHHKDGNPLNNDASNLAAIPEAEHHKQHEPDARQRKVIAWKQMPERQRQRMLAAAANWHRSEEGRRWHSAHTKRVMAAQPKVSKRCEHCGATFDVKAHAAGQAKFCSNSCKSAARRKSRADDVTRRCPCGSTFRCNRYLPTRTCSRSCGTRFAARAG